MAISSSTTLTEVQPGLFFSTEGNLVDLRGPAKLIDNIRLIKENQQTRTFRIVIFSLSGVIFLSALFFWPAKAILRRVRRKGTVSEPVPQIPETHWLVGLEILAAFTSLVGLICLVFYVMVPTLIYVPWPLPFVDLAWWQFALISLPFANLVLTVGVVVLALLALRSSGRSRSTRWCFLAVGLTLLVFNAVIIL